jgi:hypothetical protein
MSQVIYVNGADIEADLGLTECWLTEISNWGAATNYERGSVAIPGEYHSWASPIATATRQPLRLSFIVKATTVAGLDAQLATILDHFTGLLEIKTADAADKVLDAYVTAETSSQVSDGSPFMIPWRRVSLDLAAIEPKRDAYAQSVAVNASSGRESIPLGTLPSVGRLLVLGSATTPVVSYRDAGGTLIGSMTFATLGSTVYLDIDLKLKTITKYTAGVASNGLADWTAGDFFTLDPGRGSYAMGGWPTLDITSGTAMLIYERRWRS